MQVKVLYKTYEVLEEPNLHNAEADLYGEIDYQNEIISINSAASINQKKATIVHEAIHALDEMYRIGLEEEHVEKLGNAIYMMIVDNPELIDHLAKE